jgi:hypothetical protein
MRISSLVPLSLCAAIPKLQIPIEVSSVASRMRNFYRNGNLDIAAQSDPVGYWRATEPLRKKPPTTQHAQAKHTHPHIHHAQDMQAQAPLPKRRNHPIPQ